MVTAACVRCGTPVPPGARACSNCGADVSGQQGQVATAYVPGAETPQLTLGGAGLLDVLRRATAGDYDVRGELGAGGMATVYLAHDLALDRKVAIKVMSPALLAIPGMVDRFKREARTAANLSHPHIIPIFAVKQSEQLVYFVMKYIDGRSLESLARAAGPMPLPLVQGIVQQAAGALGYAHRAGVVHRDIKPANIMVDKDGWVVVADFGIAKVAESSGLTMTGATIGTPSYMSPEQCEAKRELTGASDQYSLGIVAYELLTGRLPFQAETTLGLLYAHVHEPPPAVTDFRPDTPPEVAAALMRMLEKDPARRFPDCEAAARAIGTAPLGHDDPVRDQLRQLARAPGPDDIRRIASTPISPLPATRHVPAPPAPRAPAAPRAVPPTRVTGRRWPAAWWALPVAAALGLGAVVLWISGQGEAPPPPAPPRVAPETVVVRVPTPLPEPPTGAIPPRRGDRRGDGPTGDPGRERQRVMVAQAMALGARARATARGVPDSMLRTADAAARRADSLARAGDFPAALDASRRAQGLYAQAEKEVLVVEPLAAPAGGAVLRDEIAARIEALALAFESRDLSRLRRVYPGLTPEQAQEWGQLFMDARNLDARFSVADLERRGDVVVARVSGGLDWESLADRSAQSRVMSWRATLAPDKTGWVIVSLR